jgi:ribosomal RNA assembly protein
MNSFTIRSRTKIKKAIPLIEARIKIKISLNKNRITLRGDELNEFLAEKMLTAVDFGFDPEDVLLLINPVYTLEFINIKEHTHRKNLREVRGRVIGTEGRAKKTIEELSGSAIVIHENQIGVIVHAEHLNSVMQALVSLVQGGKHSNIFSYLEKQNATLRRRDEDDLGLKEGFDLKE